MGNSDRKPGLIKRLWKWWRTPSRLALGTLLLIGLSVASSSGAALTPDGKSQYRRVLH